MNTNWKLGLVIGVVASCGSVQDVQDRSKADSRERSAAEADDDEEGDDENEVAVALDLVPAAIKKAALAAVPGFVLESAKKETEEGTLVYCLEGRDGDERVEVEVRADNAEVVEIERGEDDD